MGGYGAVFWMWLIALLGGATAFTESTLAQIYKRRNPETGETTAALPVLLRRPPQPSPGGAVALSLIATYAGGQYALLLQPPVHLLRIQLLFPGGRPGSSAASWRC